MANQSKGKHHKLAMSFLSTLICREDDESFKERSRAKSTDSKVNGCLDINLGEVLFHNVMFCDKEIRDLLSKIYRISFSGIY